MIFVLIILIFISVLFSKLSFALFLCLLLIAYVAYCNVVRDRVEQLRKSKIMLLYNDLEKKSTEIKNLHNLVNISNNVNIGILQVDNLDNLVFFNKSFYNDFKDIINEYVSNLNDVTNKYFINKVREAIISNKKVIYKYNSNIYEVKAVSLAEVNLHILQFYDVTVIHNVAQYQKNFLADASHELKNPLASIAMASKIVAEELNNEVANILVTEVERMRVLITELIDLSKLEGKMLYDFSKFNFSNLCSDIASVYKHKYAKFSYQITSGLWYYGNAILLRRVIENLIDNAIAYSNDNLVEFEISQKCDKIVIRVLDRGIGISKRDLSKIFERFYRVDEARQRKTGGFGLGLAIVKQIVQMHNGEISVTSKEHEYTEFIVLL